eukprot:364473-Chlamydomonas_euryale.AAC.11
MPGAYIYVCTRACSALSDRNTFYKHSKKHACRAKNAATADRTRQTCSDPAARHADQQSRTPPGVS